jgi:hypothetical protein
MGRPQNLHKKATIEIQASPKLVAYLDQLMQMEGFGETRPEIVKKFVWDGINQLLLDKRVKQK